MKNSLATAVHQIKADDYLVQSAGGEIIDTTPDVWRIGPDHVVSWNVFHRMDADTLDACQSYIRHLIRNNAPAYVAGQHRFMRVLASDSLGCEITRALQSDEVLHRGVFEHFKSKVRETVSEENLGFYTGAYVRWYIWATDAGFDIFDPEVATEFETFAVGQNPQGQAVLSSDPDRGPLREVEMVALRSALKAAEANGSLDLQDLALAWLMIAFGTNPKNLALLEEQDLLRTPLEDGQTIYELRIPRIKKRTANEREQFRTRRVVPEIAQLIEQLIEQNQAAKHIEGCTRPLFRSNTPRRSLVNTVFEAKAFRQSSNWFNKRLAIVSSALGLRNFTGEPLHLTPRRLRYSFATRLVQEGASIHDVADALDHSSTDHVLVYFNARSDAVRQLDRALSIILAPVAQAFMGKIIKDQSEATRGRDPRSQIKHRDGKTKQLEALGNCGDFGVCGLFAPIACYTCKSFQAWLEGPHEAVLDGLLARREQKLAEGADPKWTQLHDETILAVQWVILKCEAMKTADRE